MSSNSDSERVVANRYLLRRELGRGGMGVVWEALDPELDRIVAIKQVLLPGHFTDAERDDAHARVRREAQSAARISHPTVITIHDVFFFENSPWVVMELVEGGSLQDMLNERGALPPKQVAEIAESLLMAVQSANAAGVLHRDIKPGNIMMSTDGRVILTDFGIATMEGGPSITRTGALVGSPEYMPPERLEGGPAEHRGDLWSIGVTLYAAVEGRSPFGRDTLTAAIAAVISAPVPPMARAGWLEPAISGLLERDLDRRLTVEEALALLRERGPDTESAAGDAMTGAGPGAAGAAAGAAMGASAMGAAGSDSGQQQTHHAASGGYPAHPSGGYPAPSGGYPAPPGAGYPRPGAGPQGGHHQPAYQQYPHQAYGGPPPHQPGHPHGPQAMHAGGYGGGPGGPPGHGAPGGAGGSGRGGPSARLLVGVGAGAVALLLIAVLALGYVAWSSGQDEPTVSTPEDTDRPRGEPAPDDPGDNNREDQTNTDEDDGREDGDPPDYDDLTTFRGEPFNIDYPEDWLVDDEDIDDALAIFHPSGHHQQAWVYGWLNEGEHDSSSHYLDVTNGGTSEDESTYGFEQLDLEEVDDDDFPSEWDVAFLEADFQNDTWETVDRRFWAYAITTSTPDGEVMYAVTLNVPRDQADFYEDLPEELAETFEPHA